MDKQKIWIDCDPGIDDALALIYALKSDAFEIMGISVTDGNTSANKGYRNLCTVLDILDIKPEFPIGYYASKNCLTYAEDTHGANGLGNYQHKFKNTYKFCSHIGDKMWETVINNPGEITLVCLGPENWVDTMSDVDLSKFRDNVKEVVLMGGCCTYPGNCSPVTEFNFWTNPTAAKDLFEYFANCNKLRVISLDVTHHMVLTSSMVGTILGANKELGEFVRDITKFYAEFHKMQEGILGCVINDPLVFMAMEHDLLVYSNEYVQVTDVDDETLRGQMLVDRKHFYKHLPNAKVSVEPKCTREALMDIFIAGIVK